MYGLRRTNEPANPAVDREYLQTHLRLFDNSNDTYLADVLVPAAVDEAEAATHRQLITAAFELTLDRFPCHGRPLLLPRPPLQEVTSVKFTNAAGDEETWDDELYQVVIAKEPGEIWPVFGQTWPVTRCEPAAVRVVYLAGYGDDHAAVPKLLKSGMYLHIGHLFMNRQSVVTGTIATELPKTTDDIYRRFAVGDDFTDYDTSR